MEICHYEIWKLKSTQPTALRELDTQKVLFKTALKWLFVTLFPVVCGGVVSKALAQGESPQISFQLDKTIVTVHEPIGLSFIVTNTLEKPIRLYLGIDKVQFFEFSLATPDGKTLRSIPPRSEGFFSGTGSVTVGANETYTQHLLLNEWFRFDLTGQYVLTAALGNKFEVDGSSVPNRTATFYFSVENRDPAHLRAVCEDLAHRVVDSPDAEAARQPALALSYVTDPIAVPYLKEILFARKLVEPLAIADLERIGGVDAVNVLLLALEDKFGDTSTLSQGALRRIQNRTSDPALKERIRVALTENADRPVPHIP